MSSDGVGLYRPTVGEIGSTLTTALERSWAAIREVQPKIPDVVMLLGVGSEGKRLMDGHFAESRWRAARQEKSEVMVAGEVFQRGPAAVLTILLHEAAHAWNFVHRIKDTTQRERYHNEHFAAAARRLGLQCHLERGQGRGWEVIGLDAAALRRYKGVLEGLAEAHKSVQRAHRIDAQHLDPVRAANERLHKPRPTRCTLTCKCNLKVWCATGLVEAGGVRLRCDTCGHLLVPQAKSPLEVSKRSRRRGG